MPLGAKICGLSESDQIQACVNCGASMCGYILFYPIVLALWYLWIKQTNIRTIDSILVSN